MDQLIEEFMAEQVVTGHDGGSDPLTLLLLQKNGGGNCGSNRLLPLLLTGGGLSGKDGHVNPLFFTLLGNRGVSSGGKHFLPLLLSGELGGAGRNEALVHCYSPVCLETSALRNILMVVLSLPQLT